MKFTAAFVSRARSTDESDGFDICHWAFLKLSGGDLLQIFEAYNYKETDKCLLCMNLSDLDSIRLRKFRSAEGHYCGGRVEFVGIFDRPWLERITIKMELEQYENFKKALEAQ